MKKTTRVLSAALAVLLVPVCACIIYISGGSRGVDDLKAQRSSDDIANESVIYLDDEAIALADTSGASTSLRSEAMRAFNLVNSQRSANGLPALVWDNNLESAAAVRAQECSVSFSHTRPNGSSWYTVNSKIMGGETIAAYDKQTKAFLVGGGTTTYTESLIDAAKEDSSERTNLLYPEFKKVGIRSYETDTKIYWAIVYGY